MHFKTSQSGKFKIRPLEVHRLFPAVCNTRACDVLGGEWESVADTVDGCIL